MTVTSADPCDLHPNDDSGGFPLEDRSLRGTVGIQSTPRGKPGPWKQDLWGSRLISAPIEVSPTFYTSKSQRVPTPWAIWRTAKGIAWVFVEAACSLTPTRSLGWRRSHRPCDQGLPERKRLTDHFGSSVLEYQASRPNLHLLSHKTLQRIHQSIIVSSRPRRNYKKRPSPTKKCWLCAENPSRSLMFCRSVFVKGKPCSAAMHWVNRTPLMKLHFNSMLCPV